MNTRRLAERLARHLSERLGDDAVTAHHGSLSKERRLDAEGRLKSGHLKALVATASLELGIDIGYVDLVCQIGSPHRIATLLQRVGRSGHTISGTPKGRVFPVSRDDLVECAALLRSVRAGLLDATVSHDAPLDVLAQQIVAETACCDYAEDDLYALVTRAWPYRALDRASFDRVLQMTADGFATRRGRRGALVHRDEVHATVRGRRGARLLAQTSGGAIPDNADYRVVLDPEDTFIGTLNEDFAIESHAGDIFQLGNASWLILQVAGGTVRVADARGAPPNIPFWLGEAPARSDELSRAVSDLRSEVDHRLNDPDTASTVDWVMAETGLTRDAADQLAVYLAEGRRALGVIPSQDALVLERFFDESGGMQLVLHAPFGSRINKAWGLALRKRFCRQFNFELQAAATDDALMLSLGPQHSFPLSDVFRYLHPETTREVLVQALLDAPIFKTRWRWNTTISLAVPRARGSRRVAAPIQRMLADDLMAAVFPDAAACLENIPGDRQIPDHPLVSQAVRDCLEEAMDVEGLRGVLRRIHGGELRLIARDTPEPSLFAHEILNARPYAFLDDAPLEERRSHAVQSRRATDATSAGDLGTLDREAIERVREEERPDPRDADELHDSLLTAGVLTAGDLDGVRQELLAQLTGARRACHATVGASTPPPSATHRPADAVEMIVAVERLPEIRAIHPHVVVMPAAQPPASRLTRSWTRREAIVEIVRGRLTVTGPVTAAALARAAGYSSGGRGRRAPGARSRRNRAPGPVHAGGDRARVVRPDAAGAHSPLHVEPVARGDRTSQPRPVHALPVPLAARRPLVPPHRSGRAAGDHRRARRVRAGGRRLGTCGAAGAPRSLRSGDARHDLSRGRGGWARLSPAQVPGSPAPSLVAATPIALFLREHEHAWRALRPAAEGPPLGAAAQLVLSVLRSRGASFFRDLAPGLRPGCRPASAVYWRPGRGRARHVRWIRRAACAGVGGARTAPPITIAAASLPVAGRPSPRMARTPRATRPSNSRRGRCFGATAWCSGACSHGRRTPQRGASWRACTAAWKRAARSGAAVSSPGCRASSSRCPSPSNRCERSGA